jgi:ornithine cyclodeaminase/alanine dehydrogenase-like protein (mu-crystallin family)
VRVIAAAEIERLLDYPSLVEAIHAGFSGAVFAPTRHHHWIARPGAAEATMILMPAWQEVAEANDGGGFMGVKIVTVFPDNAARAKPSVLATYVLMAGDSGEVLATLDGAVLTLWRTAATSALAASALARPDASRLAMIGAGAMAPRLIAAHAAVLPIASVTIWNHMPDRARSLAAALDRPGFSVTASEDLEEAVAGADIVSVATLARTPLVRGAWLKPGTHVDLVGAYTPQMREADDETIRRATVYVDTRPGMRESGDIAQPLASGVLSEAAIAGDLFEISGGKARRRSADEITLFKSVGHAIEDLAAAVAVWRKL